MKVIKKINNNCALCIDNNDRKVVAFGKGIGFRKPPYEIKLSQIERIYYDIDEKYMSMINDIPTEILELSEKIIDYAIYKLDSLINPNVIFTLADHINFAIKRYKKNIQIKLPVINDIQYIYDVEMDIGIKSLKMINHQLNIHLPEEEAIYIALHIINAEIIDKNQRDKIFNEKIIDGIDEIIEKTLKMKINKNSFNYSRFVTHLYYLLKRGEKNNFENNIDNYKIYQSLILSTSGIYKCALKIKNYLEKQLGWELTNDEMMYLILHINRLCYRENFDE